MARVDVPVRAPTGGAWLLTAVALMVCGEVLSELQHTKLPVVLGVALTHTEAWLVVGTAGLVTLTGATWLIVLYVRPGRLTLDAAQGTLQRQRRRGVHVESIAGPLPEWSARVLYFSDEKQRRGVFKRIELSRGDFTEVLLFTDLPRGEELAAGLASVAARLGRYEVALEVGA